MLTREDKRYLKKIIIERMKKMYNISQDLDSFSLRKILKISSALDQQDKIHKNIEVLILNSDSESSEEKLNDCSYCDTSDSECEY